MRTTAELACVLMCIWALAGCGGGGVVPTDDGSGQGWSRSWGTMGPDHAWKVTTDGKGGIYVAGAVRPGDSDDVGAGSESSTKREEWDAFLGKWNAEGELVWFRIWGGAGWDWCRSVAVDDSGGVYVTGEFQAKVDFNPGPGSDVRESRGSWDAFLAKYNSDGEYRWARTWGGAGWEEGLDVAIDGKGNALVVGSVAGISDFDPGPGVENHETHELSDAFLVKYSSEGEYIWGRDWGGEGWDWATGVAVSEAGSIFVCGSFAQAVDFDPGPQVDLKESAGSWDAFLMSFDEQGNVGWVRTWGGALWDEALEVVVNESSGVFVTGFSEGEVDFDPGAETDAQGFQGVRNAYVTGFDLSGAHEWANAWRVGSGNYAYAIDSDHDGNLYVTGFFSDTLAFDKGSGGKTLVSAGMRDIYVIGFVSSGRIGWSRSFGGYGDDYGIGIVSDGTGSLYVCGAFKDWADLDPGPEIDKFQSKGDFDIWLVRMRTSGAR